MGKPKLNLESVQATLIKDEFATADLRPSILVLALRDKKKDYFTALTKSANLIKEFVDKILYPFLNNKTTTKMWPILKDRF